MYTILNPDLEVVGILDLNGKGCKFYNDLRTTKIADTQGKIWADTLSMSVPYGYRETEYMTQGYHLLRQGSDGRQYCYRIFDWEDSAVGPVHVKTVQAINLLAWDLWHKMVPAITISAATSMDAFNHILKQTGWSIEEADFFGGVKKLEIGAGNNAMYWLDNQVKDFDVELRAYVEMYNGKVFRKCIDFVDELGDSLGYRFEYSHDLTDVSRRGSDQEMYTKLYVFGGSDKDGDPISISAVNDGKEYIVDDEANDRFNNGGPYLEGYIVSDDIQNTSGLLTWGKLQMEKYNHPKYTYTVGISHLNFEPSLGDHVTVLDFSMEPELTIAARAIEVSESIANPNNSKVTLGEFVEIATVTPSDIWALQAKASQAAQAAEAAKTYKLEYYTPDGTDFKDESSAKRIVIRVFMGVQNITEQIDPKDFTWQKIDANGLHDEVWEKAHKGIGNIIYVGPEVANCIIRCEVSTDEFSSTLTTLYAEETDASYFATLQQEAPDGWTDYTQSVAQYAQVDSPRNHIYWSQVYSGSKTATGEDKGYVLTKTDLVGKPIERMWCLDGGHGSHYGIEYISGKMWIWSYFHDVVKGEYWVVKFPFTANKQLKWGDSSIVKLVKIDAAYRVNLDTRNDYVLFVQGISNPVFRVYTKANILAGKLSPSYSFKGSDINYFGTEQTYQSACLDYPYMYMTSGSSEINDDQKIMYCIDIRSKSLVYRIVYTFNKGTINAIANHYEPETISVYYDSTGKKWLIQGFAFGNDDVDNSKRINQLFRINEHKRGDIT